jgi:broad specificity phosphatase PhoE
VTSVLANIGDGVIVSHAGWIRAAASILLGEPLASMFERTIDFAHAAIFELDGGSYRLEAFNVRVVE